MNRIELVERERRAEAERASLLHAALEVFTERGYRDATISDVLKRAELTSASFYRHFGDKQGLFLALIGDCAEPLLIDIERRRREAKGLAEFVEVICQTYFEFVVQQSVIRHFLVTHREEMRAILELPALRWAFDELQRDISEGVSTGRFPDVDPEFLTASIVGVSFEMGLRLAARTDPSVPGAVAFASNVIVAGVERMPTRASTESRRTLVRPLLAASL